MLASSGDRIPPWGVPVTVSRSVSSSQRTPALRNAFTKPSTRLSPIRLSHPAHEGRVVDLVEARLDVRLQHPARSRGRRREVVDLGDGVLGSAPRAEAVGARLEVRLEDRFEHQLEGGLHDPVPRGRDAQGRAASRRPWGSSAPAPAADGTTEP